MFQWVIVIGGNFLFLDRWEKTCSRTSCCVQNQIETIIWNHAMVCNNLGNLYLCTCRRVHSSALTGETWSSLFCKKIIEPNYSYTCVSSEQMNEETLHGGQFTFSTQVIKPNCFVILLHRRSITVSLETYHLYSNTYLIIFSTLWCSFKELKIQSEPQFKYWI